MTRLAAGHPGRLLAAVALLLAGCEEPVPQPCRTSTTAEGRTRIDCPDGTAAVLPGPGTPAGCVVVVEEGRRFAVCAGGQRVLLAGDGACSTVVRGGEAVPVCDLAAVSQVDLRGTARLALAGDHAGIRVEVEGTAVSARTDAAGAFLLPSVPAGQRTLRFEREGYAAIRLRNVAALPGVELPEVTLRAGELVLAGSARSFTPARDGRSLILEQSPGARTVLEIGTGLSFPLGPWGWYLDEGRWVETAGLLDVVRRLLIPAPTDATRYRGTTHVAWLGPERELRVVDLGTGEAWTAVRAVESFLLDRQGPRLAYVVGGRLHVLHLGTGDDPDLGPASPTPLSLGRDVVGFVSKGIVHVARGAERIGLPEADPDRWVGANEHGYLPVIFSPAGSHALYRSRAGELVVHALGGAPEVLGAALSAWFLEDGRLGYWMQGAEGLVVHVRDLAGGAELAVGPDATGLRPLATGLLLASAGTDLLVLDREGRELVRQCARGGPEGGDDAWSAVTLAGDRHVLARDCEGMIQWIDGVTGERRPLAKAWVSSVSPDGASALLFGEEGSRHWDPVRGLQILSEGPPIAARFSDGGRWVIAGPTAWRRETAERRELREALHSTIVDDHAYTLSRSGELWVDDLIPGSSRPLEINVAGIVFTDRHVFWVTNPRRGGDEPPQGIYRLELAP